MRANLAPNGGRASALGFDPSLLFEFVEHLPDERSAHAGAELFHVSRLKSVGQLLDRIENALRLRPPPGARFADPILKLFVGRQERSEKIVRPRPKIVVRLVPPLRRAVQGVIVAFSAVLDELFQTECTAPPCNQPCKGAEVSEVGPSGHCHPGRDGCTKSRGRTPR